MSETAVTKLTFYSEKGHDYKWLELLLVEKALIECKWNRTHAAEMLCMNKRTLSYRVNEMKAKGFTVKLNPSNARKYDDKKAKLK